MSRTGLASLLLLLSHGAVLLCGYFLRCAVRRSDLAPAQRRRKRCPACQRFIGETRHRCPHRYAVRASS